MGWFGESTAHKQARYQRAANEQLQGYNLENMEIQQGYNVQNMATQYGYEQALMQQQFDYNRVAFNMENAYNTPAAQRERMAVAGLNPNWSDSAAIGQMDSAVTPTAPAGGSPSGGASGSASPPSANPAMDMIQLGSAYQDIMESRSRMALNEAQQRKAEAETQGQLEENSLQYGEGFRRHGLSMDLDLKGSQEDLNLKQSAYTWQQQQFLTDAKDDMIKKLQSEWDLNLAKSHQIYETLDPILKEYAAKINNLNRQAGMYDAQANYYNVSSKYKPVEVAISKQNADTESYRAKSENRHYERQDFVNELRAKFEKNKSEWEVKNLRQDEFTKYVENLVKEYAWNHGYSQLQVKGAAKELMLKVKSDYDTYLKNHPKAQFGEFVSKMIDDGDILGSLYYLLQFYKD